MAVCFIAVAVNDLVTEKAWDCPGGSPGQLYEPSRQTGQQIFEVGSITGSTRGRVGHRRQHGALSKQMARDFSQGWQWASWFPKRHGGIRQLPGRTMNLVGRWSHKIPIGWVLAGWSEQTLWCWRWLIAPGGDGGADAASFDKEGLTDFRKDIGVAGRLLLANCIGLVGRECGLNCCRGNCASWIRKDTVPPGC